MKATLYSLFFAALFLSPEIVCAGPILGLGDANGDGVVDDVDASIMATNWRRSGLTWIDGDFSGDGRVDERDASILASHWHREYSYSGPGEPSVATPEPASLLVWALLGLGFVGTACWRKQHDRPC